MSEQWAIAIVGFALGVIGWAVHGVSDQIKELGKKIDKITETMVTQNSCNQSMGAHCKRLTDLETTVKENTQTIAILNDRSKNEQGN